MDMGNVLLLIGGLGLFLYGMKLMSDGLEATAGDKLRVILEKMTKNRFSALGLGAGVTAVIQSSGATTVMVVGFVNAGLMTLTQAINVGIGANIGTTITAQIVALNVTQFAPIVLFAGVMMMVFVKVRSVRRVGQVIGGLGILLFGMEIMGTAVSPLQDYPPFIEAIASFKNPLTGVLVGLAFTAATQSSSATMGIMQAFAMQGLLGLDNAVYMIMGANIGAVIPTIIASLPGTKTAKRFALALVFFNILGTAIFMVLLNVCPLVEWIESWTPGVPVKQLANFHTFFNVLKALIFIWCPQFLEMLACFFIRGEDEQAEGKRLKYIGAKIDSPAVVVGQAALEIRRMARIAAENFTDAVQSFIDKDQKLVEKVNENEKVVNYLNSAITDTLTRLSQAGLSAVDSRNVTGMLHIIMDVERISDIAQNIADSALERMDRKIKLSKKAQAEIKFMSDKINQSFEYIQQTITDSDKSAAQQVMEIEDEVDRYEIKIKKNHVKRLKKGECSPQASTMFTDLINMCERIADHEANIAQIIMQGDLR